MKEELRVQLRKTMKAHRNYALAHHHFGRSGVSSETLSVAFAKALSANEVLDDMIEAAIRGED